MKMKHLSLAVLSIFFLSCGNSDHTDAENNSEIEVAEETAAPIDDLADFKFHTMIANLPSPLETFHLISGVSLALDGVGLTPTEDSKKLSTMSAKAYGYGIYMTDMGFMAYEKENQKTLDYYQTCRELAQSLGAGDVFDQTISANFEENTSSEEKFVRMMDEAFTAMDEYMVSNERFVNATEIFVGSWVETQLIATTIIKDAPLSEENKPVYQGIYDQKMHASNLMNVLSEIETELSPSVINQVEEIMMFYAGFSTVESITSEDLHELETKLKSLKAALIA